MNRPEHPVPAPVPFIDVMAQRRRLRTEIDSAVAKVLDHGQFIMGPEVHTLEAYLSAYSGARHVISCASGTDALLLSLMAKEIGPGDAVICPSFTFCATAEVAALLGATPVFVDIEEDTFNINPAHIAGAVATARKLGLKPRAVIPVDLFGLAANHGAIADAAAEEKLFILDDAAQGFGATFNGRRLGTFGHVTATSFFPAKPLGCFGDGGAIFTDDDVLADIIRSLRVHGQGSDKYDNVRIGVTGRLDTIQAAILIEKLKIFDDEIVARNKVAKRYNGLLRDVVTVPEVPQGHSSVWAQYTIRMPGGQRGRVATALKAENIPTAIYYPIPLHRQKAYRQYPVGLGGATVSERLASEVLSLPMHPYLDEVTQDRIVGVVRSVLAAG